MTPHSRMWCRLRSDVGLRVRGTMRRSPSVSVAGVAEGASSLSSSQYSTTGNLVLAWVQGQGTNEIDREGAGTVACVRVAREGTDEEQACGEGW